MAGYRRRMQRVTSERDKNTLRITLDDGKANVLGSETLRALAAAVSDAKDADAVLLRGRAKIFSGGLVSAVRHTGGPSTRVTPPAGEFHGAPASA